VWRKIVKEPTNKDPIDILGNAYERFYEHVAKNLHEAEEKTIPLYNKLVDEAKHKIVEIKDVTEQDAEKVADWVKRDIADLSHYLKETGNDLKDWLGFEKSLLKTEFLDLLLKSADKTTLKLFEINNKGYKSTKYKTGEVVGPGILLCDECHHELHFKNAGKIPPCPKCNATSFHRYVR
jgi:hypothetical protein